MKTNPSFSANNFEATETDLEFIEACKTGSLETVKNLHSSDLNLKAEDKNGYNALQKACSYGHPAIVTFLIKLDKTLINHPNSRGWTAAHSASAFGRTEIVRLLITHGARNTSNSKSKNVTPSAKRDAHKK